MEILAIVGKILFAALFIDAGRTHFQNKDVNVGYAKSKGIPFPEFAVVGSGLVLIISPILLLIGVWEVVALSALAIFLFLTCIMLHNYWQVADMATRQMDRISFYKNAALVGAILVILSKM